MIDAIRNALAPTGTLRAGINLSNMLLVTGASKEGDPIGVSPDMAALIADRLGVPVSYHTYPRPGLTADGIKDGEVDIVNIAYEEKRAETIAFANAYCEIEATYLVPAGSSIHTIDEVDRPGIRIAVAERAAYDLYLTRTLKHAELVRADGLPGTVEMFVTQKLDVLAGLRPALLDNVKNIPGARILEGRYTTIRQSVGMRPGHADALAFLNDLCAEARSEGIVASLIERHGVGGKLSVAT